MIDIKSFKLNHGYEIDGFWYPRVTSICGILSKPGLFKYYAEQANFESAQLNIEKAANWGKNVHEIMEKLLVDKKPKIDQIILPSIVAFERWRNCHKIKVIDCEKTVLSNKHQYAGTFDVLAEINGKMGILDLKTSTGIWDDYCLQTAAYFQAFNENSSKKAKTRWILRIDQFCECVKCKAKKREKEKIPKIKGGKANCNHQWTLPKGVYQFKEFGIGSNDLRIFLTAKKLWEWSNRNFLKFINNYHYISS